MRLGLGLGLAGNSRYRFSPGTLFSSTAIGIWLDPSDLTTMYQDAAGTTAVTTPGQPVGLRLDKSKGLVLGAEIVANGDFSGGTTGWAANNTGSGTGSFAVVSGQGVVTTTLNYFWAYTTLTTVVGRSYRVTFNLPNSQSGTYIGKSDSNGILTKTNVVNFVDGTAGAGDKTGHFVATATTTYVFFQQNTSGSATFDNVSVRELAGNHATAPTDAARPIYGVEPKGGRRNLLTYTEAFNESVWVLNALGVGVLPTRTLNAGTSPAGVTACRLAFSLGGGTATSDMSIFYQAATIPAGAGVSSVWLRSFDGTSSYTMQLTDPTGAAQSITVTGGWQRFQVTATSGGAVSNYQLRLRGGQTPVNSNTADVLFSQPQVETGSTATAYQRVTTAYDVTEAGVQSCHYVQYDGSDDSMSTSAIDFTGTDKMSVFAGVRKLSDATFGMIVESSVEWSANAGSFYLSNAAAPRFETAARGSAASAGGQAASFSVAAPTTSVLTGTHDIAGDLSIIRSNGVAGANGTADKGTGTFGNYPLFIGRRNNATLPFNGKDYGIIVVGKATTADEITSTEKYMAGKTGVTL